MTGIRIFTFIFLLALCGCSEGGTDNSSTKTSQDSAFNSVKLTDLKNLPIDLKRYAGKTVFINFWATWCGPCIQEMPSIEKAKNILQSEEVVFLMASSERPEEIETFKKDYNYDFNYTRIENIEDLGIQALPTTFIFNPKGKLVFSEAGYRRWDDSVNIEMILKINKEQ